MPDPDKDPAPSSKEEQSPKPTGHEGESGKVPSQLEDGTPPKEDRGD